MSYDHFMEFRQISDKYCWYEFGGVFAHLMIEINAKIPPN